MASTTIRVDVDTHRRLLELCERDGVTLMETVRRATDALARQRFAQRVERELDTLKADEAAWSDYMQEASSTDVRDGIG